MRGVEQSPAAFWGDYMRGDDGLDRFPFVRRRGNVALIALSSGVPTGPFMATGRLGAAAAGTVRGNARPDARHRSAIVLIHHPPLSPPRRHLRRLTDAAALRRVLAEQGAELLLHGHDHRRALVWLDGPHGTKIPAVGVPSASAAAPHGEEDGAGYHLFKIDGAAGDMALRDDRPAARCRRHDRRRRTAQRFIRNRLASNTATANSVISAEQKAERNRADRAPAPPATIALRLIGAARAG